jgi:hypothetical protein
MTPEEVQEVKEFADRYFAHPDWDAELDDPRLDEEWVAAVRAEIERKEAKA